MAVTVLTRSTPGDRGRRIENLLRYSPWDGALVGLSFVHAGLLLVVPSIPVVGIGLWWTANTVAHNFIHTPFFRSRSLNRLYSAYLSALMGIPQNLWRDRHLRHHRGQHGSRAQDARRGLLAVRWTRDLVLEAAVVLAVWMAVAAVAPAFFVSVYVPGYMLGLGLCYLQGHFEHARGTTSHYGWLYNRFFFNDGYHAEHHLRPGEHWTRLPGQPHAAAHTSRWPPVLRWLDAFSLDALERGVLRLPWLQRLVLGAHERAFRTLLPQLPPVHRVTIIGGGLFPRTALILQRLLPDATLTIVDARLDHLEIARTFLNGGIELRHELFDPGSTEQADLVVIPLSFIGDRDRVYREPAAPAVLVHDWMWKSRGGGVRVSWLLLKRLNLVTR
jgi:hypothetical protein